MSSCCRCGFHLAIALTTCLVVMLTTTSSSRWHKALSYVIIFMLISWQCFVNITNTPERHQLGHMQVCTFLQTDNHAGPSQYQMMWVQQVWWMVLRLLMSLVFWICALFWLKWLLLLFTLSETWMIMNRMSWEGLRKWWKTTKKVELQRKVNQTGLVNIGR